MSWTNVALWNAQIALLAAAAAALAAIFRLRPAPARLLFWQVLLAVCLALPAIQPWRQETVVVPAAPVTTVAMTVTLPAAPAVPQAPSFRWTDAAVAVLAAGFLLRLGWFGLGLARLARYRRAARLLHPLPAPVADACRRIGVYPEIALSAEVSGPVTFGFRDPVVLLPALFPDLDPEVQSAVASHELLHVRRRDWLFTAIEELVRAVFWFHPAVWWTLGQIQLAREQSVDRAVVKLSQTREQYVDALLALSGARTQLDLAPAPLFLRRRHLTARVSAILKEADMSRKRLFGTLAACASGLLLAGWLVCGHLPLEAAPQYVQDAPGVTVTGADRMMHRSAVPYPAEAREKNIEGTLVLDVVVAADGTVTDATVLSGPPELRSSTLKSVLGWHFRPEAVGRQQVIVEFKAPSPGTVGGVVGGVAGGVVGGVPRGVVGGVPGGPVSVVAGPAPAETLRAPRPLGRVHIMGLSKAAEADLRNRLSLPEGQMVDDQVLDRVRRVVREFDEHLTVSLSEFSTGPRESNAAPPPPNLAVMIYPASGVVVNPEHAPAPGEVRDSSNVPRKLTRIDIRGISPEAVDALRRHLPAKEGDMYESAAAARLADARLEEALKAYDPHLRIVSRTASSRRSTGTNDLPDVINLGVQIAPAGSTPMPMAGSPLDSVTRRLARIDIQGLAPDAAEELRRRLPVKEGQVLRTEDSQRLQEVLNAFDPHLSAGSSAGIPRRFGADGKLIPPESIDMTIHIRPMDSALPKVGSAEAPALPPPPPGVQRIRIGGNVQQAKLKYQEVPVYPDMAKQARLQGVVRLQALIDTEGKMKNLSVLSGHPLLVPAAMESVKQWQYQQTFLNGTPVEVVTQVDVNFSLSQ